MSSGAPAPKHPLQHSRPKRLWFCSVLAITAALSFVAAIVFLALGFLLESKWLSWGLISLASMVVTLSAFLLLSTRVRCRVCGNPLLLEKHCNKHPSAKTLFGSYTLGSSLRTACTGTCGCMYCGEPNFIKYGSARPGMGTRRQEVFRSRREDFEISEAYAYELAQMPRPQKARKRAPQTAPTGAPVLAREASAAA